MTLDETSQFGDVIRFLNSDQGKSKRLAALRRIRKDQLSKLTQADPVLYLLFIRACRNKGKHTDLEKNFFRLVNDFSSDPAALRQDLSTLLKAA
ncbi:MAG: hypothetical protein FJY91_01135 [Candidatus Harrisonbacteria bacterium]|nr:hypothetical protein [Candidatus Harrisonbacteria bacterium]